MRVFALYFCIFCGIPENHVFVTKWVPNKDLALFIPANCTESRDGHNGHIPRPQKPEIQIKTNQMCVICAKPHHHVIHEPSSRGIQASPLYSRDP